MKKIIILLLTLTLSLIHIDSYAFVAKKIDLKLAPKETGIIFLRLKNSNSLLINEDETSNLFILDYKSEKGLKEALKIFSSTPTIHKTTTTQKIDNINIIKTTRSLKFQINNYTLCIHNKQNQETKNCDFIYIMNLDKEYQMPQKANTIFYDDDIKKIYLKQLQESWIDNYIVSKDSFTILKLNQESYNIMIIPSTKP